MASLAVPLAKSDEFDAWGGATPSKNGGLFSAIRCCQRRMRGEGSCSAPATHGAARHFHKHKGRHGLDLVQAKAIVAELGHVVPTFELEDSFRQACGGRIGYLDYKGFVTFMGLIDDHVASQGATEFHAKDASENQSSCILFGALTFVTLYLGTAILYGKLHRKWTVITSVYFGVVTFTTVGYGDYGFINPDVPVQQRDLEKYLGGLFVFCGVVFIGAAAGTVLDEFAKRAEIQAKKTLKKSEADIENHKAEAFDLEKEICALYGRLWKRELPTILITTLSGAWCMCQLEDGWTFADGFYWAAITMTTVGYGDLHPTSDTARLFCILYILLAFGVIASAVSFIASIPFEVRRLTHINEVLQQFGDSLDLQELKAIAYGPEIQQLRTPLQQKQLTEEHGASVSRSEFVIWQLLKQEKVDFAEDIANILSAFDQLDSDSSGRLTVDDIELSIKNQLECAEKVVV